MPIPILPLTNEDLLHFNQDVMTKPSGEWLAVFMAGSAYLTCKDSSEHQFDLAVAIYLWRQEKDNRSRFRISKRRGEEWINALESDMTLHSPSLDSSDLEAIEAIRLSQQNLLRRALEGARIVYNKKDEDFGDVKAGVEGTIEAWKEVAGVESEDASRGASLARIIGAESLETLLNDLMDGIEGELKKQGIRILYDILGKQLCDELSKCIPYIGTIKEGKELLVQSRELAKSGWRSYKTNEHQRNVRSGTPQQAVGALKAMLERDVADLGLKVASSAANFGTGLASTIGTGSDAGALISRAVTATVSLIKTIYDFARDWNEMAKGNKLLASGIMPGHELLTACPFLGAQVIELASTSDLIRFAFADNAIYAISTEKGKQFIETLAVPVSSLKLYAHDVIGKSRFVIKYGLTKEEIKQIDAGYANSPSGVSAYAYRAKKDAEAARMKKFQDYAHTVGQQSIQKRNQAFDMLQSHARDVGRQAIEAKQAREKLLNNIAKFKAYARQIGQDATLQKIKKARQESRDRLAVNVHEAIGVYKSETTGMRGVFTRQSPESLTALRYLDSQSRQVQGDDSLIISIQWLLGYRLTESTFDGLSKQLKKNSRFSGLLLQSYTKWLANN